VHCVKLVHSVLSEKVSCGEAFDGIRSEAAGDPVLSGILMLPAPVSAFSLIIILKTKS